MNFNWIKLLTIAIFLSPFATYAKDRVFVTNEKSNNISVINAETLIVEDTIDVGDRPRGIGLSPDSSELYVAVSEENKIVVIDPNSLKILRDFEAGSDPETFAVHPSGNIYISNEDDAKASVYDPKTGKELAVIKVGLEPEGVAISPDGERVIVTSESTNMLHVIKFPENVIGRNTESNIQSGIMYGAIDSINGMIQRIINETKWKNPSIIVTGGFSELIKSELDKRFIINSNLTLEGLNTIHNLISN